MLLRSLAANVLELPRVIKRLIVLGVDISLCLLTVWLAYYLRLDQWVPAWGHPQWRPLSAVLASVLLAVPIFVRHGFYRVIFRYTGLSAVMTVTRAFFIYGVLFAAVVTGIGLAGVPRSIGIIQPMLLFILVAASRAVARFWLGGLYVQRLRVSSLPKVLIYGAGHAGRQLAGAMAHSPEMRVAGFLDDDERLHGQMVNGLPVFRPSSLPELVAGRQISTVLLALPSVTQRRRNEILAHIRSAQVAVRTLPSVTELAQGRVSVTQLRDLDVDDLLGREPVAPDRGLLEKNIKGKVVLVTGAGGSIGSELCRQILAVDPEKLLLIEQSEFALYAIHQELEDKLADRPITLVPLLASVQDGVRMHEIMAAWRPHTVYHAAAYKHVPLVEHNPTEGVKNNVLGTLRTAQAAARNGVPDFVLVSTDKAVRPTNVMGASKRLAEMVLQALATTGTHTRFTMVRFGNVLDSSGSVVPRFRKQIRDGGPITLTHPDITRYFMTIPEAAQLVIQAGAMARGGDVFVLDMGQPVRIMGLARKMVELSGLTIKDETHPDGDIEIEISGLRPGEKLYEELLIGDDPQPTSHPKIMKTHEPFVTWAELEPRLSALERELVDNNVEAVRLTLQDLVRGYSPHVDIVDWLYLEQETEGTVTPAEVRSAA